MALTGWTIAASRCQHLEDGQAEPRRAVFAVNLVQPRRDNAVPGEEFASVSQEFGQLFYPWRWSPLRWRAWGSKPRDDGTSYWVELAIAQADMPDPGPAPLDAADLAALRDVIEDEIDGTACRRPFSTAIEDFLGERSLAHSLTQLTVWPALMSHDVLCQSLFIEVEAAELEGVQQVVCFPEFSCARAGGAAVAHEPRDMPEALDANGPKGKQQAFMRYAAPDDIRFLCLAAQAGEAGLAPAALELGQGRAQRAALNDELHGMLQPVALMRQWLAEPGNPLPQLLKDIEPLRLAFGDALWRLLGDGRDIGHNACSGKAGNVVDLLVPPNALDEFSQAMLTFTLTRTEGRQSLETAAGKLAGPADGPPNAWTPVQKALHGLLAAADSQAFAAQWQQAAQPLLDPQQATEFYGPWLQAALTPLQAHASADLLVVLKGLGEPGRLRLMHWMRGRLAGVSAAQWAAARALADKLLERVAPQDIDPALKEQLVLATIEQLKSHLAGEGGATAGFDALPPDALKTWTVKRVDAWLDQCDKLIGKQADRDSMRAMDRGLRLHFSAAAAADANRLRGYAIALCAGVELQGQDANKRNWRPDIDSSAWLTDTAAQYRIPTGPGPKDYRMDWLNAAGGGEALAWMHDTVGATVNDGEAVIDCDYAGQPLACGVTNPEGELTYDGPGGIPGSVKDLDGFKSVNFAWHGKKQALPPLGFGLSYRGVASPVDNAGGIVDSRWRGGRTRLKAAKDIDSFKAQDDIQQASRQYRCNEVPGLPRLVEAVPAKLQELSDETRAEAFQRSQARREAKDLTPAERALQKAEPEKVALLAFDKDLFRDALGSHTLKLRPPGATAAFIERWLATDRVLLTVAQATGTAAAAMPLSDPEFARLADPARLQAFIDRMSDAATKASEDKRDYHPAVAALGVEVWAPGMSQAEEALARVVVPIKQHVVNNGVLDLLRPEAFELQLTVKAVPGGNGSDPPKVPTVMPPAGKQVTVNLPQGAFARIRVYSLVDLRFFRAAGHPDGRFAAGLQKTSFADGFSGATYARFDAKTLWFETLPAWNDELIMGSDQLKLIGVDEARDTVLRADELEAMLDLSAAPKAWAPWLRGVQLERHEWHWTGYPVSFPDTGSTLPVWQRAMAGTQTYRASDYAAFDSDVDEQGVWRLDSNGGNCPRFHRHPLPSGRRPARYAAVLARPVLRFRRWMSNLPEGAANLEQGVWGSGCLVAGRGGAGRPERLPVPALRQAIPLTATYDPTLPAQRLSNGVLLVLDEALRRTDDLALSGGLGETLELDVLDTRVKEFSELGVNPLMHANPGQPLEASIEALEPFGLSFDIGRNPKVAQTGLVIRPKGSGGRWMMAHVRLRRTMLPESDLDSRIAPAADGGYELTPRIEGNEKAPPDFAIDLPRGDVSLQLGYGGAEPALLQLPPVPAAPVGSGMLDEPIRYVVSWHRDRWGAAGEPHWRCQVLAQQRKSGDLAWRTVGKRGGLQQQASQLKPGVVADTCTLRGVPAGRQVKVYRMRLSDYTESRWLPFIGSFGMAAPVAAPDLVFRIAGNGLELAPRREGVAVPALRGLLQGLPGEAGSDGDPCFDLVLVSRSPGDVTRADLQDGGQLVSVLWKTAGGLMPMQDFADRPPQALDGCTAHVIRMQRITSLSSVRPGPDLHSERERLHGIRSFEELLKEVFPGDFAAGQVPPLNQESLVRFLPEYIGPIPVVAA